MTKIFKYSLQEPLDYVMRHDKIAVYYGIEFIKNIKSVEDVQFKLIKLKGNFEIANPDSDIVVLVGNIQQTIVQHLARPILIKPDLWYWDNKFWLKAVNDLLIPYYFRKMYAFYEVQINSSDDLLACLKTGFVL